MNRHLPLLAAAVLVALALVAVSGRATRTPAASSAPEGRDLSDTPASVAVVLRDIKVRDKGELAVSEEDGRFLRVLVASGRRTRALEIGAASGYSAIWMALALRETGGRLVTIEYDAARAQEAAANVRRAGLTDVVQVVAGDAFAEIPRLPGTFDFVFLDAWKKDYLRFFELVFPRLEPGGVFVAHNVVNKRDEMGDFLSTIHTHPSLWTTIVSPSGEGMSVSYRKRWGEHLTIWLSGYLAARFCGGQRRPATLLVRWRARPSSSCACGVSRRPCPTSTGLDPARWMAPAGRGL